MSVRTIALLAICCLPLAAQSRRAPLTAIPASVINHADTFVLAQGGQARLYNFTTGVNGTPFLQDVYKSFGLSPDGRHFLYLKAKGKFPTFQLYSYDLTTGTESQITDAPVHKAVWSPAGSVLAYVWLDPANEFHISTRDIASGADVELATGQLRSDYLEWAPDGQELLYMTVTPLTDRAAEDGKYSQSLHRYSLRRRSEAVVPSVDWAQYSGNQLVVAGRNASLYRSIPNPRAERIQRFALVNGTTYAEFTDQGRPAIKRWNEANSTFEAVGKGQIFLTTPHGVVVRQLKSSGIEYQYISEGGDQPLSGNDPGGSTDWKMPFHGSAAMVQGGSLYQDGSCDGAACFVVAHTGTLGYALDWQQIPQNQGGTAHVLATADGTVAITANNVTCNTGSPTCFVGWDDYNSSCPVTNFGAGNYVAIAHLDGTYSFYGHLKSGSLQVVPGQQVFQGTYLADQGHSGVAASYNNYLSCGDHLHFSRQIGPGVWEQSIPTDFVETPCLLGCAVNYTSANVELAPTPTINAIVPSSWTPGSAVQVTLTGQAFVFGSAVSIDDAGVTVSGVTVLGPNRIVATLSIPAGTAVGTYNVTVTAANGSSNAIPFQILAPTTGGTLTGAVATPGGTQSLTNLGTADWTHWGFATVASFNRKAGVVPQIGNYTVIGNAAASQYVNSPTGYSWTNGAPTTSATNTTTGVSVSGQNNGFSITAPADTTPRTLRVYVGVSSAQGALTAQLSDASASGYIDLSLSSGTGVYTLTYAAASAGQTLVVSFTQNSAGGSVNLQAATLSGGSTVPDFAVSMTPATKPVAPGSSTTFTVATSALSGFAGSVDLSVAGLPSGVTADLNPATVTAGGTSTLTLTASAATAVGNYPVSLTATSGALTHMAAATLAVVNADFTLTAAPATRTVVAGGSAVQNVSIAPLPGFSGTVSLSASGMPAGVSAAFSPGTLAGSGVSALTFTASVGAVVGNYPITVTAATGSVTHSTNFTLSVSGAAAGGSLAGSTSATPGTVQLTNEGTIDWAHWGLNGANGYNRKSGITPQIAMSLIGGTTPNGFANNPAGYTWTNGTPTVSVSNTTTGIYMLGQDRGFRFTVPADTTQRTMRLYVGVYQAQGRLLAQLSDGSAPDYLDTSLINSGGTGTIVYTLNYRAASAGQTLTVRYTQNNLTIGNVTLEAVTLTGPADFSVATTPATQSVPAGGSAPFSTTVSALNNFAGSVALSLSGLPAGASATFTPPSVSGSGTSSLVIATSTSTPLGTYPLVVTATSGALSHTNNLTLTVTAPVFGGSLSGAFATPQASIQLTTEGTSDWAHWGLNTATDFNHKNVTPLISNFTQIGSVAANRYANNPIAYSWTDGTPTASATSTITGLYISGQGNGFRFTVPAGTASRTLRVYVGVWRSQGTLVAHLSDNSAPDYSNSSLNVSVGTASGVYTLTYAAATNNQTLTVTFIQANATIGNVTLQAASLSGGSVTPDFSIAATPGAQAVTAGASAAYTATVTAINGFSANVDLTITGLPAGASAIFTPASVSGSGAASLSISTSASTPAGSYPLVVTGTSGALSHTANITLNVTDFSVSATPATQTAVAGASAAFTATVTALNGFAGSVGLTISGLPVGAGATFTPATVNGSGSSSLSISTSASTPTGSYPLVVTGTSGALTHTANITLNVTDFSVSATPATQSAVAGSSVPFTATVTALNGFSSSVALSISGLPGGASASFSPSTVAGSGSSTLTITTAANTAAASYPLVITATSGAVTRTTGITLTVTNAPEFTIGVTPFAQPVVTGDSGTATVTITALNGFADTVGLSVTGLPAGAGVTFNPASINGSGSSVMTVTTQAGTLAGSYPLTVTATSGTLSHSANLTLTVTDFSIGATPATQPVVTGGSTTYSVTVSALSGFSGSVALSISGLPPGAGATFNPATISGSGASSLMVTTAPGTSPAGYPLVITATSGALSHTVGVTLNVTDFSVGATPSTQSIMPGSNTGYAVTVSSVNGFAGTVGLTVSGLPAGATAGFNPATLSGSGSSTLTVTAGSGVAAGNYPLTITATSGSFTRTAGVTLTVTDFSIAATPPSQSVLTGASVPYTVDVTALNGFSGTVGFAVSGLPSGASAGFSPASIPGSGSSTMTVTTAANTAPGSYPLTITATSGTVSRTSNVTLIVTAPPDFTQVTTPSSQAVVAGLSATFTTTVSALNGFAGSVALSLSGLPAGASATFTPASVNGSGTSSLAVSTSAATPPGSYPLVVTGTSGALTHTNNVTLIVTAPGSSGSISGAFATPQASIQLTTEGTSDWAQWGLNAASDFNHKNNVTPQIGNFTQVGSVAANRFTGNPVAYSWSDGAPTASATASSAALYISGQGNGYRFTVPASTTPRSLRIYVGVWRAQGTLVAHLSDNSAPDYTDSSLNVSVGTACGVYTLAYVAASNNQTLTVTFIQANATVGNVTLQAATLAGGAYPADFSIAASPASRTVVAGGTAAFTTTVTALNGFSANTDLTISGLPVGAGATFTPASISGSGSASLSITTSAATPPGSYPLVITGTSGALSHTANITLTVTGVGALSGSSAVPAAAIQLTTEGTSDWTHWGLTAATDWNHKNGVTSQIGNFVSVAGGTAGRYADNPTNFTWTDGTPTATATGTTTGLYLAGQNQGFRLTLPADTTTRTVRVYAGAWRAQSRMVAHLSDGSAVDITDTSLVNTSGPTTLRVFTFTYKAASNGQTLTLTLTQTNATIGNVTLQAATLQ